MVENGENTVPQRLADIRRTLKNLHPTAQYTTTDGHRDLETESIIGKLIIRHFKFIGQL